MTWDKEFITLTIAPVGRYKIAGFYDLTIADTARARDGGKLKEGWYVMFETMPLPKIMDVFPKPNSNGSTTGRKGFNSDIVITFASPMKLQSLKSTIIISPQPKDGLQWYFNDSNYQLSIFGLEPATEYVVRILPGMADIYGNTIKAEQSFAFKTGDLPPYARLVLPWTPLVYRAKLFRSSFGPHAPWLAAHRLLDTRPTNCNPSGRDRPNGEGRLKLSDRHPIFVGYKMDGSMHRRIESLTPSERRYVSSEDSSFLRVLRLGEDEYIGKVIAERLTTERVDDIRRNVLSILQRLSPETRFPTQLDILVGIPDEDASRVFP